ncbi:MAG: Gfo/Idh/MocA family oxidoreductase [Alistipes sp.]
MNASQPVRVVVVGAGNRAHKYLEYALRHPDRLQLVGVVDPNGVRRRTFARQFALSERQCYTHYDDFFAARVDADMVLISTPDDAHFDPTIKAINAGYHVLLEKPIAQRLDECHTIARLAKEQGVVVGVCHILRYHPYFNKIKEIVNTGELGKIVSIDHTVAVGLDRATHSYVRGIFRREQESNPIFLAKCCHDLDFLLWLTGKHCRRLSSFGSLRWFRAANAPAGCAERCIACSVESKCPFSAKNLYAVRKDWISNFDIPEGATLDEAIEEELRTGMYGRCVYRCDNDVVDHQLLALEMEDEVTISMSMDVFTCDDFRKTHIRMTNGEIDGNEYQLRVRQFRGGRTHTYNFADTVGQPFHAGADLRLIEDFLWSIRDPSHQFLTPIEESIESHLLCYEADRSRLSGQTVRFDNQGVAPTTK